MLKKIFCSAAVTVMALFMSALNVFAGEWKQDENGYWYDNGNGTYPMSGWVWIDSNADGFAEGYCFDSSGYLYINTITPDGHQVNQNGAWIVDGIVQIKKIANNSSIEEKINILTAWKNGLYEIRQYLENELEFLKFSRGFSSEIAGKYYLAIKYQENKSYISAAIEEWNKAILICGNYDDTQQMKEYIQQDINLYISLINYPITSENVFEYVFYENNVMSISDNLGDLINEIIDVWVEEANLSKNQI